MADLGQTYNSSMTYQHLVADNPDVRAKLLHMSNNLCLVQGAT